MRRSTMTRYARQLLCGTAALAVVLGVASGPSFADERVATGGQPSPLPTYALNLSGDKGATPRFHAVEVGTPAISLKGRISVADEAWLDRVLAALLTQQPELVVTCEDGYPPWTALRRLELTASGEVVVDVATEAACSDEDDFASLGGGPTQPQIVNCVSDDDGDEHTVDCSRGALDEPAVARYDQRRLLLVRTEACTADGVCPFRIDRGETMLNGHSTDQSVERFVLDCEAAPVVCAWELTLFVHFIGPDAEAWCAEDADRCPSRSR